MKRGKVQIDPENVNLKTIYKANKEKNIRKDEKHKRNLLRNVQRQ